MPKRTQSVETKLQALQDHPFGRDASGDESVLVTSLQDKHYRVVARAAKLAAERLAYGAIGALKVAFVRLLDTPTKSDPQCQAKQAIARALVALDCTDAQFYLSSVGYRQLEPVWGGSADTAVEVRAACAMGLVNSGYPNALHELTTLLCDSEPRARVGAVRAIACGPPNEAELLLRYKAQILDADEEVAGETLAALMTVAGAEATPLVARQLNHPSDAVCEYAALALGESQLLEALAALRQAWDDALARPVRRAMLLRAIALHRTDASIGWLIELLADASTATGQTIVEALSIYKANEQLKARVAAAVAAQGSPSLQAQFTSQWCEQ